MTEIVGLSLEFWLGSMEVLLLAVTLGVTAITGWFVWRQARSHFEFDKTMRFIERWNDPAFSPSLIRLRDTLTELAEQAEQGRACLRASEIAHANDDEGRRIRGEIVIGYNLLQELGAAYKRGVLHDGYFRDVFASITQRYFEGLSAYVLMQRIVLHRASLLEDWEQVAAVMRAEEQRSSPIQTGSGTPRRLLRSPRRLVTDTAVFGYGSLVHPDSAARTVRGPWSPFHIARLWPAELAGMNRAWNYEQEIVSVQDAARRSVRFLGLEAASGARCSGVLVPVRGDDLDRLDTRERFYDRVDVTEQIIYDEEFLRARDRYRRVYTYVPREPADPAGHVVIPETYRTTLTSAKELWGPRFAKMFASLDALPDGCETFGGKYRFPDAEQNAAAGR
ncbi:MAG: gamma-glutamylcyclotransferase family protein [Planctomycetota bacterium]